MSGLCNGHRLTRGYAVAIACGMLLSAGAPPAGQSDERWRNLYNVRIENVTVAARDARTAAVTFDISWQNSWRDKTNHDAAWVFFKVRADGETGWQHVRLAADKVLNPTGYGQEKGSAPLEFLVPDGDDGFTGLFVRRTSDRLHAALVDPRRHPHHKWRGVRTAPKGVGP